MCEDSKAWGAITTGWGQRERTPPRRRARTAAGRRRSSRRRAVLSPAGSRGLLFSSVPRKSHFHRDRFAVSGTLIRKINYLHPASLLFFDSVRSVGLKQGFLFKGEQVGFLRVGRAAFPPGRPLAAVGGQGKRGRSGRRPGAADRSEAKRDCEAAGRGAAGRRAGDLQLLLGGGHFFGGPVLLREGRRGGRGGVSGNHTRPGPARCACKAASTAPPQPPRPWWGAVRQDAEKPQHAYGILRLCFLGSR